MKKLLATILALAITASGYAFVDQEARDRITSLEQQNKELVSQINDLQENFGEQEHTVGEIIDVKYYDVDTRFFDNIKITIVLEKIDDVNSDNLDYYYIGEKVYYYKIKMVGKFSREAFDKWQNTICYPTLFISNYKNEVKYETWSVEDNEYKTNHQSNDFYYFNRSDVNEDLSFNIEKTFYASSEPIKSEIAAFVQFYY